MKQNELQEFAKNFLRIVTTPNQITEKIKEDFSQNSILPSDLTRELKEIEQSWNKPPIFIPIANIKEGSFAYHVELEMPGIKKEDIDIEIKDSKLIVSGEKKHERKFEGDNYTKLESRFGKFKRIFVIGEVDKENISASMVDGILEIVLPKIKKSEKKIEIK